MVAVDDDDILLGTVAERNKQLSPPMFSFLLCWDFVFFGPVADGTAGVQPDSIQERSRGGE
jgi:hypothetical protein